MTSRADRLEALLEQATALPAADRARFADREVGDDPALRAELISLLRAADGAEEYLGRLQEQVLGSAVGGVLRDPAAMADAPDPWIGGTVSHYQILDRIGGGGMGVVYRARDLTLDRLVALKFIAPELRRDAQAKRRFLREAQAASQLDHLNICTVHEIAETDDGRLFIVMTAYDGETLRARVDRGPLPEAEALGIAEQIARALAAAHARDIVHRDVKPDNVFITRDGVVKLLDFGLARVADSRMSGAGGVGGTVGYMSPEQARGGPADARSDVWALGVILFEMLAGARPFRAEDAASTIELILTGEPDLAALPRSAGSRALEVIRRCLSQEPANRFPDGGQVLAALRDARSASAPSRPVAASARRKLRPAGVVVGAALLVVAAAAGVLFRRSAAPAAADAPAAAPRAHVLWVDDDPSNNRFIIDQFTRRGVEVTTALNTRDAVAWYDSSRFQLVVSDMGRYEGPNGAYVPRAGLDLLAALTARHPSVQVVYCTSERAVAEFRREALAAGARDILSECEVILRILGIEPERPG